jgi:hypothetical protein
LVLFTRKPKERDYKRERQVRSVQPVTISLEQSPLKLTSSEASSSAKSPPHSRSSTKSVANPLQQPQDPLRLAKESEQAQTVDSQTQKDSSFIPWSSRKAGILQKYTTTEQIIIPYPSPLPLPLFRSLVHFTFFCFVYLIFL